MSSKTRWRCAGKAATVAANDQGLRVNNQQMVRTSVFVDGRFEPAHGTASIAVVNPATAEQIGAIPVGDHVTWT
jgi:hypothetical protein